MIRTITGAAADLRAGRASAAELVEEAIARADAFDPVLGVFLHRDDAGAREAARAADDRFARGEPVGPLDGIPLGVKDILAAEGGPTTAQSLVLDRGWAEGIGDAPAVARLRRAGGIVLGKLTTMEFALGVPDPGKPFPVPRNAWNSAHYAGGSSSGCGSGVASGMVLGALGSDTAGSIRMPAGFNGVTGLKPTFGRVPKAGMVPLSYTLDHVGPLARSARDCALLLSVLAGHHPADPYAAETKPGDYLGGLTGDLRGVRVGVDDLDRFAPRADPETGRCFAAALGVLADAGAELVPVDLPMYPELQAIDSVVMLAEALSYHEGDLRARGADYGQATRVLLSSARAITAAHYLQAMRVRRVAQAKMDALLETVDLIATPMGHLGAPSLAEVTGLDPTSVMTSLHTAYWNPLGNPVLVLPMGLSGLGLPLALSLAGRRWEEGLVVRAGDAVQQRTAFHLDEPPTPVAAAPMRTAQGAEDEAVAAISTGLVELGESLANVSEARYADPSGGFDCGR
ncbi:MAG TPA: amidase [Amycolatopsis sp.]|uniref:amidase n=1 Tax=unclassified Amycolatopsis TaxID=2618356 RepID=UPI00106E2DD8|nr:MULTISPECIES: amidase [unclassified Amycolatopsis]HWD05734.1 amidase [Amycolatopsis sp.]